jgi:hypothetical protein
MTMMKRQLKYIAIVFVAFLWSCEITKDTEGISRITYYPLITLKGQQWNTVAQGSTFTDPGVTALEGDTQIEVKVSGSVNTAVPGVYTIQYDAVNKDGYPATEYRYVGVIAPAVAGIDITGSYKRNAGAGGISKVTKISNNLFYADNVGGVAAADINPGLGVYFYFYDVGKLGVPYQLTPGNAFDCTNESIIVGVSYSWVVVNSGYGTALRTFVKQP